MTPIELREFQAAHTDWEGKPLVVDGIRGPKTLWALAVSRLEPRRQEIVRRACGAVGIAEEAPNRGLEIDAWVRRAGAPLGSPWCAAFASWCISVPGLPERCEASAQTLGRSLRSSTLILPGDLAWFATGEWTGHVGVIVGLGAGELATVEGNQRDAVRLVRRSLLDVRIATPLPVEEFPCIPPGLELLRTQREGTR